VAAFRICLRLLTQRGLVAKHIVDEAYQCLMRVNVGDESLVKEVLQNAANVPQEAREFVLGSLADAARLRSRTPRRPSPQEPPAPRRATRQALPEPTLSWQSDLGVARRELPVVRAEFYTLLQVEKMAGELQSTTGTQMKEWLKAPPARLKDLAEAARERSREALERRLGPIGCLSAGEVAPPSGSIDDGTTDDRNRLCVSRVMAEAGVWRPVWNAYRSDLSNRILQLKCEKSRGAFDERVPCTAPGGGEVLTHLYLDPEDWGIAWLAVEKTRWLYEKRVRELLEDAVLKAGCEALPPGELCARAATALAQELGRGTPAESDNPRTGR
jgi:hypothetical protein